MLRFALLGVLIDRLPVSPESSAYHLATTEVDDRLQTNLECPSTPSPVSGGRRQRMFRASSRRERPLNTNLSFDVEIRRREAKM